MRKALLSLTCLLLACTLTAPLVAGQGRRLGPKARAAVTIGSGAAIGAGVGALLKGKKGAAIGALLGGGGTAAVYLLKTRNRNNNRYDNRSYYRAPGRSGYARSRRCR